jgi:hypothetical protein
VQIEGAFFGALVADALTLGTHYEYDAIKIKKFYGQIDKYVLISVVRSTDG